MKPRGVIQLRDGIQTVILTVSMHTAMAVQEKFRKITLYHRDGR